MDKACPSDFMKSRFDKRPEKETGDKHIKDEPTNLPGCLSYDNDKTKSLSLFSWSTTYSETTSEGKV